MAPDKEPTSVSWEYALGVGGAIIVLLLSINGWLLTKGFGTIETMITKNVSAIEKLCDTIHKNDKEGQTRDSSLIRRMDRMEVLITMPFEKRIEVLKSLRDVRPSGEVNQ